MQWKYKQVTAIFILMLNCFLTNQVWSQYDLAYQHLYQVMDKYHTTFDVFTDQDAGGNNFHPTLFGDYDKLEMTSGCLEDSLPGWSCLKIKYISSSPTKGWAGVYWLYPDKNWGDYPGHTIKGADSLMFWARGNSGGEKVEFKAGGINHFPGYNSTKPCKDSCDLLSTGIITLSKYWKKYAINLVSPDSFAVYIDSNSGSKNHYIPAQWFNGTKNMEFNDDYRIKPHSGTSCIRVHWNGKYGNDFGFWNGIMWQVIEGDMLHGYDLNGATKLTFYAKTDQEYKGLKVKFFTGYYTDSCGEILYNGDGWATLDTSWQRYTIKLQDKNLSNLAGGFGFAFDYFMNLQHSSGFTFYIDDIKFDKEIKKDVTNLIGGFCCAIEKKNNPRGCTIFLDNISYHLTSNGIDTMKNLPHFLVSYDATASPVDLFIRNTSYIYDNALAMLAFINSGTEEGLRRAELLANTFLECQRGEPGFADKRLRNGYQSGLVLDRLAKKTVLPGIWDEKHGKRIWDEFSANTHTGNLAWVIIALLSYFEKTGQNKYLDCAESLAEWINENTYDDRGAGGFTGGCEGLGEDKVFWKSTEHNLDVYVAFRKLACITHDLKWDSLAHHAKQFVEAMWNNTDKFLWTGTEQDGITINKKDLVEDVQAWAKLVFKCDKRYRAGVEWARKNCYVNCDGFKGFDFNVDKDGIWFEGTAHLCLAFQSCKQQDSSNFYLEELRKAQATANHNNKLGIVAACHDSVSTGLTWLYHNRLHVGATAWYIFAEKHYNPYWQCSTSCAIDLSDINTIPKNYVLSQNFPNPFNAETIIKYELPNASNISLKIYNITGELIKTLVSGNQPAGFYDLIWNGTDESGTSIASGVYFYVLKSRDVVECNKLVVIR